MARLNILIARLRGLLGREAVIQDIEEELRLHIEIETETNIERGMKPDEARATALRSFGNVGRIKDLALEIRGGGIMDTLWQDLRYGVRMLAKNPGFSFVAMLILALGIGANTAIFSVVNGVLLRPLPYQDPDQVVMLWTDDPKHNVHEAGVSYPNFADWRSQNRSLADLALCSRGNTVVLTGGDESERAAAEFVSANLFPLLGVKPVLGRSFSTDEEQRREHVVVLSYGLWQRRFGGSPEVIGRTLEIDGDASARKDGPRSSRVIGVMPAGFDFPSRETQLWEPASVYWRWQRDQANRFNDSWRVVGRLKSGVPVRQAQAEMTALGQRLAQSYPVTNPNFAGFGVNVVPLLDQVTGKNLQLALWVLLGAVSLVLLIACANVANLLLARGAGREREFAIRAALGAGRQRLVRQLLTESVLLATGGGLFGLALAAAGVQALPRIASPNIPRLNDVSIDSGVLLFTCGLSLLSGILFGLAPAWKMSRSNPNESLKEGGHSVAGGLKLRQMRGLLVVAECALTVVLLTGAGLLVRSFLRLQSVTPGFNPEGTLLVRTARQVHRSNTTPPQIRQTDEAYYQSLVEHIAALPGIQSVGYIDDFLMRRSPDESITIVGRPANQSGQDLGQIAVSGVSPEFFRTMSIPLLKGRFFTEHDLLEQDRITRVGDTQVTYNPALVNEAFARHFFPGEDPIGKRFFVGMPFYYEIVGLVGNMRRQGLEKEPIPEYFITEISGTQDVVVRIGSDALALANAVRAEIHAYDKNATILDVTTVERQLGDLSAQRRFQTWLLTLFAAVALVLSSAGIFGVMHYAVAQRTNEIGIRIALGARTSDVLRLAIGQGMKLALIGMTVGLLAALWLTRVMAHLLFGVSATDPLTFVVVAALLAGVAVVACYLPARNAVKIDPMVALRSE